MKYERMLRRMGASNSTIERMRRGDCLRIGSRGGQSALDALKPGDVLRHATGSVYVVVEEAAPGRPARAVRSIEVSSPGEWTILRTHDWGQE